MAFVLVRNGKVVKTMNGLRNLTAAESANRGQRYRVRGNVPIYIGGTVTIRNGQVTAITDPNAQSATAQRREQVKDWLRRAERVPVANWGLFAEQRAKNYWWWLEMIAAASSVDANLSSARNWGWLEAEMNWNLADWYNEHDSANWDGLVNNVPSAGFYSTNSNGTWRPRSGMTMPASWTGLTHYIY